MGNALRAATARKFQESNFRARQFSDAGWEGQPFATFAPDYWGVWDEQACTFISDGEGLPIAFEFEHNAQLMARVVEERSQ